MILKLLHQKGEIYHFTTPFWYLILYIALSLLAIGHKRLVYLLPLMAVGVYAAGSLFL
jgi:uncharacterized membrane protein